MKHKYSLGDIVQITLSFLDSKKKEIGYTDTKITKIYTGHLPLYEVEIYPAVWFPESQLQLGNLKRMLSLVEEDK